jgi:pimeloyl-ACP methyl ester carboxylesterase
MRPSFVSLATAAVLLLGLAGSAEAAPEPAAKEAEANGVRLAYVEQGSGEPMVLVHGAVSDLRAWKPVMEALAKNYRVIAYTQRYFGTAPWPDEGTAFSVATHADDLAKFVSSLAAGPVHLVGWSYGANVAMAAALENPDLVQSLILFEPALSSLVKVDETGNAAREAEGKMFGPATGAVEEGDAEKATRLLIEGVFQMPPGGFDRQPQELRAMQLDNAQTILPLWAAPPWEVTCDMLKGFDKPTLLVYGAESNAYWTHVAEVMDECLPLAEVVAQPKVNHDGPVRDPAAFSRIVHEFASKH